MQTSLPNRYLVRAIIRWNHDNSRVREESLELTAVSSVAAVRLFEKTVNLGLMAGQSALIAASLVTTAG